MRIAVVGAGAIGAFVGACVARGGTETHLVARGEHLAAMRTRGVRVTGPEGDFRVEVHATDDPREIGTVDVIFLGLKAYSYAGAGRLLKPLMGPQTGVIAAQNGIPWWYFHGHGGPLDGRRLESVDPGGAVSATIPAERAIGCVVYPATELAAPGVVRHIEGNRISIGEPDRTDSERCRRVCEAMTAGGLKCRVSKDLRGEIWVKLLGNATFNPLSALTGATMAELCAFAPTRELLAEMMGEVAAVAEAVGYPPRISIERRLEGAESVGEHKTSMLQDLEAGKRLELDVLVGAVLEIGAMVGVDLPRLRAVHAATALLDRGRRNVMSTARSPAA
jgi:2-dehydropantoate 2-reductase